MQCYLIYIFKVKIYTHLLLGQMTLMLEIWWRYCTSVLMKIWRLW